MYFFWLWYSVAHAATKQQIQVSAEAIHQRNRDQVHHCTSLHPWMHKW
jgi:hypothetical protein